MAFLERRRFTFFDLKEGVDCGKIAEAVGSARVTSTSSGYGFIVLGDSSGTIHIVKKAFEVRSFRAYTMSITLIEQCKQLPYLITVGEDGIGINSLIKIWHLEKFDKNDVPFCLRVSRASIPNKAVVPTCIAINDNMTVMAIGFTDGSILLYRGDIKKDRTSKQTLLSDDLSGITGLALCTCDKIGSTGKIVWLYVATLSSIEMFDVTHRDKEKRTTLDSEDGCALRCSVLAEVDGNNHFFVARTKAIYCYTNAVLGPCYAMDGEKVQLHWFRGYLIIISKDSLPTSTTNSSLSHTRDYNTVGSHVITVLDVQNNVTAFHHHGAPIQDISDVLIEWNSFYILSPDNSLSLVAEKDLQSKLALLFKKNLFDVAIRVARYQQYDSDGLMEIFRQYGDHLYSKGDHKGAIEQYIKTIGKLEPSYVIRKYFGSQQVENLTTYLQALHKEGVATGGHTTLLLNFYTKLNKPELLKEFIMTKDREIDFDVNVAIDVCRHVSSEDALLLAEKHQRHHWYLTIQIEDQKGYEAALNYIAKLKFDEAENMIKKYGITLLKHIPDQTTKFLIKLCTDYRPSNSNEVTNDFNYSIQKSTPETFIHYFLNDSERLVEFLERLTETSSNWSSQVYTTLLEHYLQVWASSKDPKTKSSLENKIMRLLESEESSCDKLQALILCKTADFKNGLLHLYEKNKLYHAILEYYIARRDYSSVLGTCRRFEHLEPDLWIHALSSVATHRDLKEDVLNEILGALERGNLLSPLSVIASLSVSSSLNSGHIKGYLKKTLDSELQMTKEAEAQVAQYAAEIEETEKCINDINTLPITFQSSRCSLCSKQLELPSVHFLCQHSFHSHCIQSFADNENECPPCTRNNKQVIDAIKSQEENRSLHRDFHDQLEKANDGFSIVTDYLGRGVFTKLTNYSEVALKAASLKTKLESTSRAQMGQVKPQWSDFGAYSMQEPTSDSLVANMSRSVASPPYKPRTEPSVQETISSMLPYGDDDTNNPFRDDGEDDKNAEDSTNPFDEDDDDDYDSAKNPFA